MLVHLLYTSRCAQPPGAQQLEEIFTSGARRNHEHGITGVLCVHAEQRLNIQLLEGGRDAVSRLHRNLMNDPRHLDVTLLHFSEIAERRFAAWQMGYVDLMRVNPRIILRYFQMPTLQPESMPGSATLGLLEEVMAAAAVVAYRDPRAGRQAERSLGSTEPAGSTVGTAFGTPPTH